MADASLKQAIEKQLISAADAVEETFEKFEEQVRCATCHCAFVGFRRLLTPHFRSLYVDAFTGLRTSYMGQIMESTYRRCGLEKGK